MRLAPGDVLLKASYILFLAFYVYAPAAYGLTRDSTLIVFEWGMGAAILLWMLAHLFLRRAPHTGIFPWLAAGLVLGFGWFVTAMAWIDEAITDGNLPGWESWFPDELRTTWSSYDAALSLAAMTRTSVLLGAMLMAIDIWRRPRWARRLVLTLAFSSFAMVVFFFLQRTVGGAFVLEAMNQKTTLSFATYRYHANGAAYLNLCWPIVAAIAAFAAYRRSFAWPLWLIPAALMFFANFLNISKAGNVLAVLGAILLAIFIAPALWRKIRRSNHSLSRRHVLVALIPILVIAGSLPFAIPWQRWEYLAQSTDQESSSGRSHAYAAFLKMLPDSGWPGFGPGTFQRLYPRYVADDPGLRRQSYWVAHQDYIQTLAEWGYLGTLLWGLVLVPPLLAVGARSLRKPDPESFESEAYRITWTDHVRAFLHTTPGPQEPFLVRGVVVALILTCLHSLVDFPMQIASLQLDFLVLLALGWSYLAPRSNSAPGFSDD